MKKEKIITTLSKNELQNISGGKNPYYSLKKFKVAVCKDAGGIAYFGAATATAATTVFVLGCGLYLLKKIF